MSATTAKYVSLILGALFTLLPLSVVLFASLKTQPGVRDDRTVRGAAATGSTSTTSSPRSRAARCSRASSNTLIVLVVSLVGTIFIGTMAAYAIDRFQFRGKKLVVGLFLVATLIPGVTSQVATFQLINGLGLYDTKTALILLFMGTDIIAIYLFIQFMQSIPVSLDEAAMIDGANRWTIYWRIILPLLRPAIATVVIIKGIAIYNEFYAPVPLSARPRASSPLRSSGSRDRSARSGR